MASKQVTWTDVAPSIEVAWDFVQQVLPGLDRVSISIEESEDTLRYHDGTPLRVSYSVVVNGVEQ